MPVLQHPTAEGAFLFADPVAIESLLLLVSGATLGPSTMFSALVPGPLRHLMGQRLGNWGPGPQISQLFF